ncbi:hypothetical protein HanPSC8_Chr06g0267631 [Helianthus annuus]|nr:hypothetical protein HanPSC8_Chr06g0267631 [Helianthus annuus]
MFSTQGRVGCSWCTGGRISYTEQRTVDGRGDYCYAFWHTHTSTRLRCTTTTIAVAAYCILILLFYI